MLIGLTGYARSGKDTVGAYLCDVWGFERRAFADRLKELALENNPRMTLDYYNDRRVWDLRSLVSAYGWERAKDEFPALREYLQDVGIEKRNLDEDYWVDPVLPRPETMPSPKAFGARLWGSQPETNIVITDVRFPNEIERIKSLGGVIVRVDRPGVGPANNHVSEHAWVGSEDITIRNHHGIEDLHKQVDSLVIFDVPYLDKSE